MSIHMKHALVILCGGSSSRMGTDKALLPFGEDCLITYIVNKYQPYFSNIYLSVRKKGDYAHLKLPVTEIADIYPNAGPMSGIFSGLSMIDEDAAFFMSVDTPFLQPATAIALLDSMEDADICMIKGSADVYETSTAAYSKNCTAAVGKCLLLHQFTFEKLREKCLTKYISETELSDLLAASVPDSQESKVPADTVLPLKDQYFTLDTRSDYYEALRKIHCV